MQVQASYRGIAVRWPLFQEDPSVKPTKKGQPEESPYACIADPAVLAASLAFIQVVGAVAPELELRSSSGRGLSPRIEPRRDFHLNE